MFNGGNSPLIDCDPPVVQQLRFGGSRHCLSGSLVDLHSHKGTVNLSEMADVDNLQSYTHLMRWRLQNHWAYQGFCGDHESSIGSPI